MKLKCPEIIVNGVSIADCFALNDLMFNEQTFQPKNSHPYAIHMTLFNLRQPKRSTSEPPF